MKIKSIAASLMVDDVNATHEFYENILGFEKVLTYPAEGSFEWAMMKAGETFVHFQRPSFMTIYSSELA